MSSACVLSCRCRGSWLYAPNPSDRYAAAACLRCPQGCGPARSPAGPTRGSPAASSSAWWTRTSWEEVAVWVERWNSAAGLGSVADGVDGTAAPCDATPAAGAAAPRQDHPGPATASARYNCGNEGRVPPRNRTTPVWRRSYHHGLQGARGRTAGLARCGRLRPQSPGPPAPRPHRRWHDGIFSMPEKPIGALRHQLAHRAFQVNWLRLKVSNWKK